MADFETILTELDAGILTITLNRPDRLNAFTPVMMRELIAAFEAQLALAKGDRRDAFARFIAGAPDWREARESLSGAFADSSAASVAEGKKVTGLSGVKTE